MNVFLAACGGDVGYAQLLMSELTHKVFGDQSADRIDYDLVENLKATLKDTNVDFGPDGVTATEFLCAAIIPADRVSTVAKQAGTNSLQVYTHTHTHTYLWDGTDPANTEHFQGSDPLLPHLCPLSVPKVGVCGVYSENP